MELTPYVERLRRDLADAAAAGGPEAQAAAERLALALDPATRMMLLEALSQAAAEITGSLDHDAVDVRLNGREPEFVVTHLEARPRPAGPPGPARTAGPAGARGRQPVADHPAAPRVGQGRAPRRPPTQVGQSLNAWLVDAVRDALDGRRVDLQVGSSRITVTGDGAGRRKQVRGWVS